jgi:hypothetical protein
VCTPSPADTVATDAAPIYTGESGVVRRGTVCSYSSHGLIGVGSGAGRRLQRYERGEIIGMVLAGGGACPAPHVTAGEEPYVMTYDLSPGAFVSIMQLWTRVVGSTEAFDREACCERRGVPPDAAAITASTEVRKRLRAAIEASRMKSAHVVRIVRISLTALHRRYALFVVDPDTRPPAPPYYVIYLSRRLAGPLHITGIADAPS